MHLQTPPQYISGKAGPSSLHRCEESSQQIRAADASVQRLFTLFIKIFKWVTAGLVGTGTYPDTWPPLTTPGHRGAEVCGGAGPLRPGRLSSPACPFLKDTKHHLRWLREHGTLIGFAFRELGQQTQTPAELHEFMGCLRGDFKRRLSGTRSINYI